MVIKIMSLYQQEKNILLETFINRYYKNASSVEFIISSECNQACEYCYLFKHGHKMYPPESNNKENITRNLKLFLDYLYVNQFKLKTFDLFSGEFFQLDFWEEIFDILYQHPIIQEREIGEKNILSIPTNFSFLLDDALTERVEFWMDKFKNTDKAEVFLSCSVDGPETLEELERPIIGAPGVKQKDFYDKLFNFLKKHRYVSHPMVTKNFVLNYKENYDFWIDNIIKYDCTVQKRGQSVYSIPMFLEVRDPEQWDSPEILEKYREFLFYVAEKDLNSYHNGDINEFAMHIADDFSSELTFLGKYNHVQPYIIGIPGMHINIPCSIQSGMVCRIGDLSIVPCHRTCYPNMLFGKFELNDEKTKIIGVQGDKVTLAHKIQTCNPNRSFFKCSACSLKAFCMKGCLGSQYENTGELFGSQENVCKMMKVKYKTINDICEKYGLYDIILNDITIPEERKEFIKHVRECTANL